MASDSLINHDDLTQARKGNLWSKHQYRSNHLKEYQAWQDMMRRCYDPDHWNYPNYGGRGIRVCPEWHVFDNFYESVGSAPTPKHSLDKYPDNNGHYGPNNFRWATTKEQIRHRRNTLTALWEGKERPVAEIAEMLGRDPIKFVQYVWQRVYRQGYTPERAVRDLTDGRSGETRRNNSTLVRIKGGPIVSLQEASEQRGLQYKTVNVRCYRGATIAGALELPEEAVEIIQEVRRPRRK